jgi:CRP/FNR family transcriptional regulator, dissimilatory nitrate respiration regulator
MTALSEYKSIALSHALRGSQLFSGLAAEDLEKIVPITILKTLEKNEYLFRQGEASQGFYIVQRGAINVHRVNAAGKEQVIHIFRTGESMAEASLATSTGYPADARAVEISQVLLIQKSGILDLIKGQPELALRMLSSMALHLRVLVGQIEDISLKNVETRMANWLLKRCPDPESAKPVNVHLTSTKRVLAAELGTVSETLSRTFSKFRELKLITVKGSNVTILNPARLKNMLSEQME